MKGEREWDRKALSISMNLSGDDPSAQHLGWCEACGEALDPALDLGGALSRLERI